MEDVRRRQRIDEATGDLDARRQQRAAVHGVGRDIMLEEMLGEFVENEASVARRSQM